MRDGVVEHKDVLGDTGDWSVEMYAYLFGLAETTARAVQRKYPMVDVESLSQEALMWGVQHPRTLQGYLDDEDEKRCTRQIVGAMKNVCRDYAIGVRAQQRGDEKLIDDHFYSLGSLKGAGRSVSKRGLLHHVFDDESWLSPEKSTDNGPRPKRDPSEGNNWLATLADVSSALARLPKPDRDLIEAHFKNESTYEEIGRMLRPTVSRETVSKRMDRAVRKLQEILGGGKPRKDPEEPGWENGLVGTRRAVTNAAARAMTDHAYDD